MQRRLVAVGPDSRPAMHAAFCDAVTAAGATVDTSGQATGLIWADPSAASVFPAIAAELPELEWVQLPYAGIEPFVDHLDDRYRWTCGKGVYARPVAEHALGLALAGLRGVHRYARAHEWSGPIGANLLGTPVTIIGGGGITEELVSLLEPFDTSITVVRRNALPVSGADHVVTDTALHSAVSDARVVFIGAALTPRTRGMIDSAVFASMRPDAWLVNVARGGLVVTSDLVEALSSGTIGGAALDVTHPEPLPPTHALWSAENCIITPHVGNTPEMGLPLIADRVRVNVERWLRGEPLIGAVDVAEGY